MTEQYTPQSIEGYFNYSKENNGDYVNAGRYGNHHVQNRVSDGNRLFLSTLNEGEQDSDISWESIGIHCYISSANIMGEKRCVVECSNSNFFPILNKSIAQIIQENITGAEEIIQIFRSERIFWAGVPNLMTQEKATGLFGELYLMWKWFPEEIVEIILQDQWNGPTGADKDFNFSNLQIEVKTTMSNSSPIQHTVSTLHQLQSDGVPLVLFSLVAHPDSGGSHSLCGLVSDIGDVLANHSSNIRDTFINLLEQNDFIQGHPSMENYRFALPSGDGQFFVVENQFPRLTSEDNANDERIHIGSYRITLNNVSDLQLNVSAPTSKDSILEQYNTVLNLNNQDAN